MRKEELSLPLERLGLKKEQQPWRDGSSLSS